MLLEQRRQASAPTTSEWSTMSLPTKQSGKSPNVVTLFSATNFSSYIIEFCLKYMIQFKLN